MEFRILAKDKNSQARVGILSTPHGKIETPAFVPVGTQATVKSLTPQDLKEIGVQIFFGNTYHLHLRPGEDLVKKFGGLGKFMGWDGPTMTDSGGFQVFSLGKKRIQNGDGAILVKIDDDGVTFRSHLDGSLHRFTPEKSIEIQQKLGADIILAFDDCPPHPLTHDHVNRSLKRTHNWALRSLKAAHGKIANNKQALFGIIQGGVYRDLREESAKLISSLGFDGIAIGGVAVGESKKEMRDVLDWTISLLPEDKVRHLLGVGEIDDIFDAVERGIDMLDCVIATRISRTGFIFVSPPEGSIKNRFRLDITKSVFAKDQRPIAKGCLCYACQNFTRGYLNHLFRAQELLAYRLATYHNLYFMENLMHQIREAIAKGKFSELKKRWLV